MADYGMSRFDEQDEREKKRMHLDDPLYLDEESVNWAFRHRMGSLERDMPVNYEMRMRLMDRIDYEWFGS